MVELVQANAGSPFTLYPHQIAAENALRQLAAKGLRRLVCVIPTGGGKSYCIGDLAWLARQKSKRVLVISSRKIVNKRLHTVFSDAEMSISMIDGDRRRGRPYWHQCHIAMLQTLGSRHVDAGKIVGELPEADLILWDEPHLTKGALARAILWHYAALGAVIIGTTATPVGLGVKILPADQPLYQALVLSGTNSELVKMGLLVNGKVFAPDEPQLKGVSLAGDEYPGAELDRRFKTNRYVVWGRILENYERLNRDHRPGILFAPSVDASKFLADQFNAQYGRGFARHMDGETPDSEREDIIREIEARDPSCKLICNYGVAEVGLDCPVLSHAIFVRTFGRASTYIQAIGRVKRAAEGKAGYTLQDHSGSVWRHGHPDTDWDWKIEYTEKHLRELRRRMAMTHVDKQEKFCPRCGFCRLGGDQCPECLHWHKLSCRFVIELGGTLTRVQGPAFKPKAAKSPEKAWKSEVWAGIMSGRSLLQAVERFKHKYPDLRLPADVPAGAQRQRSLRNVYPQIASLIDARARRFKWSTKGGKYKQRRDTARAGEF